MAQDVVITVFYPATWIKKKWQIIFKVHIQSGSKRHDKSIFFFVAFSPPGTSKQASKQETASIEKKCAGYIEGKISQGMSWNQLKHTFIEHTLGFSYVS